MAVVMAAPMRYPTQQARRDPQGLWAALVAALPPDETTVASEGAHLAYLARLPAPGARSLVRPPDAAEFGESPIVQPSRWGGSGTATATSEAPAPSEAPVASVVDLAAWRARRR
jgi:hypothetical protein